MIVKGEQVNESWGPLSDSDEEEGEEQVKELVEQTTECDFPAPESCLNKKLTG